MFLQEGGSAVQERIVLWLFAHSMPQALMSLCSPHAACCLTQLWLGGVTPGTCTVPRPDWVPSHWVKGH